MNEALLFNNGSKVAIENSKLIKKLPGLLWLSLQTWNKFMIILVELVYR